MDGDRCRARARGDPGPLRLLRRARRAGVRRRHRSRRRPRRHRVPRDGRARPVPFVNLESAIDHPCQALADWKTLDDLGVPARAGAGKLVLSWANHPKALPLAVPAATAADGGAARHGGRRPPPRAVRASRGAPRARRARQPLAAAAPFRETDRTRRGARRAPAIVYAKSWSSTAHYGDAAAESGRCAPALARLVRRRELVRVGARGAASCTACRCGGTWSSPTKCSTPRSVVVRQAHNRL